ncbi:MAG TPA: recombinase, partial [Actinobacteria bacterium]|nr:recombinase [Actinomycetota bacterium]
SNFKKNDGFKISNTIARQFDFYRQNYCGCRYSIR